MGYRVVVIDPQPDTARVEDLRVFDSAYAAVDYMTSAWHRGDARARRLHLLDPHGRVLLGPDDLIGTCAAEWSP